jgi:hypothetical protein
MWPVVLVAVATGVALNFIGAFAEDFIPTRLGKAVLDALVGVATAYIAAPYLLVLYRGVATGEVTLRAEALRRTDAGRRFAAWLALLAIIASVPGFALLVFGPDLPPTQLSEANLNPVLVWVIMVLVVALAIFSVRSMTLLPLLALDPDEARLSLAFAQTRRRFWFITGISVVTLGPLFFVDAIISRLIIEAGGPLASLVGVPFNALSGGIMLVAAVALSTRLYQRLVTI